MNNLVTRFAPSPTGYLHIGSVRTALINFIIAKKAKIEKFESKFLLRIEDTDKKRSKNEYKQSILDGLSWLGIKWDDEIFIQSQREKRHKEIAYELLKNNNAYKCICSKEELNEKRIDNQKKHISIKRLCTKCENNKEIQSLDHNYCIRIKIPEKGEITINDKIQGNVTIKNIELDNFILLRNDGSPTYMLSVVVDDNDMGVNNIIRGDDHFNNTFRQIYIYKHLEWTIPQYAHLPLIHGNDGGKLSKRHGAVDINKFKEMGFLPSSIINSLILLGWSPKKNDEIIEINEIVKNFKIEEMTKSSSIFDYKKLNFFNNYFINKMENTEYFIAYVKNNKILNKFFIKDEDKFKKIFDIYKKNINSYLDLEKIVPVYYDNFFEINYEKDIESNFILILKDLMINLDKVSSWNIENLDKSINDFIKLKKMKFASLGKPIRLILTNLLNGPSISEILYILGKKNTFIRFNKYIKRVS